MTLACYGALEIVCVIIIIIIIIIIIKSTKSQEILWKFKLIEFKVIQGRSWCQSKAHMQIPIRHK